MPGPIAETNDERKVAGRSGRARNRFITPASGEISEKHPPPQMLNETGSALWKEKLPELVRAGIVKSLDRELLLAFCLAYENLEYWSLRMKAAKNEEREILAGESDDRDELRKALQGVRAEILECSQRQSRCLVEIQNLGGKIGSNPVDRGKVKLKPKKEDPFGKFTGSNNGK